MPRSSIARWVLLVALTALLVVALTGCFRVEQEIDLTGWPTAGVSLTLWVDKAFAGPEMDLLLDSLHLVVPGAGDAPEPARHDEAVESRTWTVFDWAPVEIQPGEALPFTMARQDGDRYSFTWEIGPYQGLSGQIPDDAILLSVRITFAGEVESANAAHVEGRRARWDIRKADIARGVALQATTRTQAVARVNDELIGAAAFQRAFRAQLRAYQQVQGFVRPTQMEELRYGVLNDLIAMRLIVQAARQEGILVDPQEVDAQLDEIIDAFPSRSEFERQLGLQDLTERELRVAIEENLIAQKLTETLVSRIPVTDEEVARVFEQVRARHVLVRPEQMDVEQSWNEALQRAEGIRRRVEAGADFAELARAESDDEFSRDEGGELGFFGRGEVPEPVERAAFTMAVGAVSQPIRSDFGYHIIQVLEKKEAAGPEFEAARPGLVERIRRSKADEALEQWFSRVQSTAAISILDLQLAARDARSRGELEQALTLYRQAAEQNPDDAYVQFSIGSTLAQMNRTDEALEALQRAVELAPEDPVVRLVLGNTFLEKGDRERAASLFREASELAPSDLDVHVTLYTLFSSMGLEEDAGREQRAIRTIQGAPEAQPGQGP